MDITVESKLKYIFESIFDIKIDDFDVSNVKYKEISRWDSFGHVELVSKIELIFETKLTFEDIIKMKSFKDCVEIISNKNV